MPGMAPPHGGPDAILMKGTDALHAVNEVSTRCGSARGRAVDGGQAAEEREDLGR